MINQAATHHFLPARIQGAGREREGGGAGQSPRPLQAPSRGRARRAPPSLAEPPPARLALSGRQGGGCERAARGAPQRRGGGGAGPSQAPAARVGGGEAAQRGECPGRRGRGRLDSSRGRAGRAGRRAAFRARDFGRRAAGVQLDRLRLHSRREASGFSSRPFLTCLQIPFHLAHFLVRSGVMQELAIFAVRLLSNKNMHLGRGEEVLR